MYEKHRKAITSDNNELVVIHVMCSYHGKIRLDDLQPLAERPYHLSFASC